MTPQPDRSTEFHKFMDGQLVPTARVWPKPQAKREPSIGWWWLLSVAIFLAWSVGCVVVGRVL